MIMETIKKYKSVSSRSPILKIFNSDWACLESFNGESNSEEDAGSETDMATALHNSVHSWMQLVRQVGEVISAGEDCTCSTHGKGVVGQLSHPEGSHNDIQRVLSCGFLKIVFLDLSLKGCKCVNNIVFMFWMCPSFISFKPPLDRISISCFIFCER